MNKMRTAKRILLILINVCNIVSTTAFAQKQAKEIWHIPSMITQPLFDAKTEIQFSTYEYWISNNERGYNGTGSGENYYFYNDSTFKIRSWRYSPSKGYRAQNVTGEYLFNATENEIALKIAFVHSEPDSLIRRFCFYSSNNEIFPAYSELFLKIINQKNDRIAVDVYTIDHNGEKVPFGKQSFVQELIAKDEEKLWNVNLEYNEKQKEEDETIYEIPEFVPEFPGGQEALLKFLSDNLKHPNDSTYAEGIVKVAFTVNRDGSIWDLEVVQSLLPSFDLAVINVIRKMPKWTPATARGRAVRVRYTIPVSFKYERE